MVTLGVIPARGGSKGIPRKNIAPLCGRPLIAYTIDAARSSELLDDLVVSTDDAEIADISRSLGAEAPFLRPGELARDDTRSLPVIQHAVREMEYRKRGKYEVVVMLQPTTPLRTPSDIDGGIRLLLDSGADSVISVVDVGGHHPFRMKRIIGDGILINYIDQGFEDMRPRQELPPVFIRSGALYITRRDVLMEGNSFTGKDCRAYVMPRERAVNIDGELDLLTAELLISRNQKR